jgi:UDPglucose 6-dehydrogenase
MSHSRRILKNVEFCTSALECCADADGVVIATEWDQFRALSPETLAEIMPGRVLIDLRNIVDRKALAALGFTTHSIGRRPERPSAKARGRLEAKFAQSSTRAASSPVAAALEERPYWT